MRVKFPHAALLLSPYVFYYLGTILNVLVISANQGYMPVASSAIIDGMLKGQSYPGLVIDEIHRCMQSTDHLKFLADWIQIPRRSVASPGDLCLWLGEWLQIPSFVAWLTLLYKDSNKAKE